MTASAAAETRSEAAPIGGGVFLAIVGPSGAGKDTLINYAKVQFGNEPNVQFVRRVITRNSDGATEDHDSLTGEEFEQAERLGVFALSWTAHGLKYGLPTEIDDAIRAGRVVIANVSRGVVPALRQRFGTVQIIHVTASPETLASRLANRGRETQENIRKRLQRNASAMPAGAMVLENDGSLEEAGDPFVSMIWGTIVEAANRRN